MTSRWMGASTHSLFLKILIYFLFLFLAALSLRCCTQAFSSCGERGCSSLRCTGFSLR